MKRIVILTLLIAGFAFGQEEPCPDVYPPESCALIEGQTPPAPPVKPGQLISFWRFENSSIDEIGPFSAPWDTGSEQYIAGMDGFAANFDASNNYARSLVTIAQMGDQADVSWSFWVYFTNNGTFSIARLKGTPLGYNWLITINPTSNFVRCRVMETNTIYWGTEHAPGTLNNAWAFFALTWDDSSETGILYQGYDGAALVTNNLTETGAFTSRVLSADELRIGWLTTETTYLDEFRQWKVTLKSSDIDKLYAAGPP